MTNKLNVKLFFFLLPVSCLASVSLLLGLQDTNPQDTTISTYTQKYNNETELQPTGGPLQITGIREKLSSAAPVAVQNTSETAHSQPSQGNGTSGKKIPDTVIDNHSTLRTTVKPALISSTEIKTTPNHQPTKPHRTQKTATKVCPTAEPKRENLVSQCLIAIGSLVAITTIFIMTTIILATKLSGSRHRHRASLLQETEMVCISTLMNDSDHPMPTPRHPKSNGALIPISVDEGDDLTLNSFLHDTEGVE